MTGTNAAASAAAAVAANINQEQLFHELEHKYLKLKADFAVLEGERDGLAKQKADALTEIQKLQATITERDAAAARVEEELGELRTSRDQLGLQCKAASALADRRLTDLEELQETLRQHSQQLVAAQRKEVEAMQRAAEHEASVEPLRHTADRLKKELDGQKTHLEWMERQLAEKTKTIQELRQTVAKEGLDHEELKVHHTEELASLRKQLETSRQVAKKLESSLVHAKEQVKEIQALKVHDEERFQNELSAQRRLADLYKESSEDANVRIQELQALAESLRRSLLESEEALAHEAERTKAQVEHLFQEQSRSSEQLIQALQGELAEARERIQELERKKMASLQSASSIAELSSAAGEAHLAMHGMSPKQMLDQIVDLENSLQEERNAKEQLQIYMDRIVKEVHEKAPMIMGLKLEHERAVASHAQVSERLDACMLELTRYRTREHQAIKEKETYERKCESLAKSVEDLSRQVQHLLFRAHEQQAGVAFPGDVTSENLVVFKDVEELQVRNQQLLVVIRELTEGKRKHTVRQSDDGNGSHVILAESGDESDDSDSSVDNKRLALALKEIEELRSEREEEQQMITAIVKQRDMYRVLLAQADSKFAEGSPMPRQEPSSIHERHASTDITDSRALKDLQKEFDTYKKEKQANMKMLQESLDAARTETSKFRLAQMQAEVEAGCHRDRLQAAEKRLHDADEEILRLRAKIDQVSTVLIQHQKLLADNEAKLEAATARLRAAEVEKDSALRDAAYLKKHEEKTLQELSSLRADNTKILKLMESNRQIDSAREERDRRENERLGQKVTSLENKLQETFEKMEGNEAIAAARLAEAEQSKKLALTELEKLKASYASTREQTVRLEEQCTGLKSKESLLEKEATLLREQLRKGASVAAAERVAALELQLREAQREVHASVDIKKSLTEAVSKYKAIAEANEKSMSELSAASEKWKASLEDKLKQAEQDRSSAREELGKARAQIKDLVVDGNKLRNDMDQMVRDHQAAIQQATEKQQQHEIMASNAKLELSNLQDEIGRLQLDVSTAQENYERELKLHASQVEKFAASRKQLQEEQLKKHELVGEVAELKARVFAAETEATERVTSLEKLLAEAVDAKSGLTEQNKLLHIQLERANLELRRTREQQLLRAVTEGSNVATATDSQDHSKELEDLRSVISFLRKEGEISSSKLDLANQEVQRYRSHISSLEATISRLRDDLKRASEAVSKQVSETAKQSAHLDQLALLRESNAALRDECQKNLARFKDEEQKVAALQAEIEPLRLSETKFKVQLDALKQEIGVLNDANARWKERVEQLVEKYQQVDPVEYEKVCAEKSELASQLAEIKVKESALRTEVETLRNTEGKNLEEERVKAENMRKQYDRIKGFAKTWKAKAEVLTKQVAEKSKEAEDKASQVIELEKRLNQATSDKSSLESKVAALETSKNELAANGASAAVATAHWEKERQDMKDRMDLEAKKVSQLKEMNSKLLNGMKALKQENTQLKNQMSTSAASSNDSSDQPGGPSSTDTTSTATAPAQPETSAEEPPASQPKSPALAAKSPLRNSTPATTPSVVPAESSAAMQKAPTPVEKPAATPSTIFPPLPPSQPSQPAPSSSPKLTPAPAPAPATASPAKAESKNTTPAAPAPVSAEEKLRLFALQSLKRQIQKGGNDAPKPTETPQKTGAAAVSSTPSKTVFLGAKPPLPQGPPPVNQEAEPKADAPAATSGPFLKLATQPGAFGGFGSGSSSGLVFGKPGITLPVPSSPTPVAVQTTTSVPAPAAAVTAATTGPFGAPSKPAAVPDPAVPEAQRRSQRLARFGAGAGTGSAPAATASVPTVATSTGAAPAPATFTLKRPAPPQTSDAPTPQKMAKVAATEAVTAQPESTEPAATGESTDQKDEAQTE